MKGANQEQVAKPTAPVIVQPTPTEPPQVKEDYMTIEDEDVGDAEIIDDEDDPEIVKMNKTRFEL